MVAYILMAAPTPFPVFCIGYVLSGVGAGTVQCLATAFLMKLHENQNLKQCLSQASYGESRSLSRSLGGCSRTRCCCVRIVQV